MKTIITLLLALTSFTSFCQEKYEDVEISLSNVELDQAKTMKLLSIHKYNNHTFILKKEPVRGPGGWLYSIEEYDENDKNIKSTKINSSLKSLDHLKIIDFLQINDHFILLYNIDDVSNNAIITYSQLFNPKTTELEKPKNIHELEYKAQQTPKVFYNLKISPNKNCFAINIKTFLRRLQSNPDQKSFDYSFYSIYNGENQTYVNKEAPPAVVDYNVDDFGNLFLIIGIKKYKNYVVTSTKYILQVNSEDDSDNLELDIDTDISYINIIPNKNGQYYLAGFFHNKEKKGSFYSTIDISNGEVSKIKKCFFSDDFVSEVESKSKRSFTKEENKTKHFEYISNLKIKELVLSEDKPTILLFEVSKDYFIFNDENGSAKHYNTYGGYVVNYFNENDERTYKYYNKYSKNFQNSSYLIHNNEVSIIEIKRKIDMVNKPIEELTKAERKKLGGYVLGLTTISTDGEIDEKILIDYTDEEYITIIRPKEIMGISTTSISDDSVEFNLLTSIKGNKFGFLKFTFE